MKPKRKITKAIISAAGYGTRFLPATKNVPKELLPIIDMPVLEYITQECVDAGIKDIILVTRQGNNAIEDYFDSSKELETILKEKRKAREYKIVRNVYEKANFVFVRQSKNLPYGTATPLLVAQNLIGEDEAFAYLFGDDIFLNTSIPAIKELIDLYNTGPSCSAVIGAKRLPAIEMKKYGLLKFHKEGKYKIFDGVIEKPQNLKQRFGLARPGRFIYHSSVFKYIDKDDYKRNPRGELELTDVDNKIRKDNKILIKEIHSTWYPTGNPIDMIKTTINMALKRKDTKEEISKFIKETCKKIR